MKTLLAGLILIAVSAHATPITGGVGYHVNVVNFDTIVESVTGADIPEWAKLPGAIGWYELKLGITQGGADGILLVLRGVLLSNPDAPLSTWIQWIPEPTAPQTPLLPEQDSGPTPEPATIWLVAAGATAAYLRSLVKSRSDTKGSLNASA